MALMQIIEYVDEGANEMVHRVPSEGSGEFRVGSQLVVQEQQWGVFFRDGKALDVFGPGRHMLATQNIPLLTALITTPLYGDTPFRASVYFVSRRVFTAMKWGTAEPILFRDSEFAMIRLRAFGIFSLQVTDPKLFVMKLVGTRSIYRNEQIQDFARGIIVGRLADLLGENLDSVLDLPRYFDELAAGLKARVKDDFYQYGLSLVDFVVNSITPPQEVQKRIDERSGMEAVGGMDRYFRFKAAGAMGDLASGGGAGDGMGDGMGGGMGGGTGGGTGGGAGEGGVASTAAAGLGLGAGAGLGFMIPGMMQQTMAQGQQPQMRCPNCRSDIPFGTRFCPECGTNLAEEVVCPQCSASLPVGSKFCMNCGQQLGQSGRPGPGASAGSSPGGPSPGSPAGPAGGQSGEEDLGKEG